MSSGIVFHLLAALAYAVLAFSIWRPLTKGGEQVNAGHIRRVCLAGAIVLHGIGLAQAIVPNHSLILGWARSEEHTSELQSLMRTSYAVFCLKKNKSHHN